MTTYKVTISAGDGGSVSPDGEIEVAAATDVWIYASPDEGRKVAQWYHDGQPWGCDVPSYVIPGIARAASVHVTFMPITHAVTTTPCEGGESSGGTVRPCSSLNTGPLTVAHNDSLTFTAVPEPGFRVGEWTVDGAVVARAVATYTLSGITADNVVAVGFELPGLPPVTWLGTVTVSWTHRTAPAGGNTTRRADIVLTQDDLDASGLPGPIRVGKGGTHQRRDVRTERVKAVLAAGPPNADGQVGTIERRRHDLVQEVRSQLVSMGVPARRRRVSLIHTVESYPVASRAGVDPVSTRLLPGEAAVSVTFDDGRWRLAVLLAPPALDGERREDTTWTVSGVTPMPSDPALTPTALSTPAFERRIDTGVTTRDATRLSGRHTLDPGQVTVAWNLRLASR